MKFDEIRSSFDRLIYHKSSEAIKTWERKKKFEAMKFVALPL